MRIFLLKYLSAHSSPGTSTMGGWGGRGGNTFFGGKSEGVDGWLVVAIATC